jgi:hypothetical protein
MVLWGLRSSSETKTGKEGSKTFSRVFANFFEFQSQLQNYGFIESHFK